MSSPPRLKKDAPGETPRSVVSFENRSLIRNRWAIRRTQPKSPREIEKSARRLPIAAPQIPLIHLTTEEHWALDGQVATSLAYLAPASRGQSEAPPAAPRSGKWNRERERALARSGDGEDAKEASERETRAMCMRARAVLTSRLDVSEDGEAAGYFSWHLLFLGGDRLPLEIAMELDMEIAVDMYMEIDMEISSDRVPRLPFQFPLFHGLDFDARKWNESDDLPGFACLGALAHNCIHRGPRFPDKITPI
jgi:hypothetical protein